MRMITYKCISIIHIIIKVILLSSSYYYQIALLIKADVAKWLQD